MVRRTPEEIQDFLKRHKADLFAPHVYLGQEPNTFHKPWTDDKMKILYLSLTDYASFRGNQTLPLLYQLIGSRDDVIMERAHVPQTEKEYRLFQKFGIPLFSLESKHSIADFDIIMATVSYPPPWTNMPLMLRLSGIPVYNRDRTYISDPLIMVGGSATFGNFCFAYPVADLIYIGEAEGRLDEVLNDISYAKRHPDYWDKEKMLKNLEADHDNLIAPILHQAQYDGEKFVGWNPPINAKRYVCEDLSSATVLTKPIPSYTDATMGIGEVEISRGCRGTCAFCGLGWKYRPYRERAKDKMVDALVENKRQSGAIALCPIAAEFAFYSQKRSLIKELCAKSRYVDPLSMRVDAFIEDSKFDAVLSKSGMNQIAIGVEGPSQRLRNRFMKNISAEDIKKACWMAIDVGGFKRIKFFMIANFDETWEDYEEFFGLAKEIIDGVAASKRKGIRFLASWTPLFIEPSTPLQWKAPTLEQHQNWWDIDQRMKEIGVETNQRKVKWNPNLMYPSQGLHLGDTRYAQAFVEAVLEIDRPFYSGGLKGMKDAIGKRFNWDWIMREKSVDETFPWDCVDRGVSKDVLLKLWFKIKTGEMDKVFTRLKPPIEECSLDDVTWSSEQEVHSWLLLRCEQQKGFDTVPNTHWKAQIHRAAYLSGFPLAVNKIHFLTDKETGGRNWYSGNDYIGIGIHSVGFATPEDVAVLNEHLIGLKVTGFLQVPDKISWSKFVSRYRVLIPESYDAVYSAFMAVSVADKYEISIPPAPYSASPRRTREDVKAGVFEYSLDDLGSAVQVDLLLSHNIPVKTFLRAVLKGWSYKRIDALSVVKTDLLYLSKKGREEVVWTPVGQ